MDLTPYVDDLRQRLAVAAEAGGEEARQLADRLTAPLEAATRLVLLEALSAAADEITSEMAPGTVEVRLRGGDPSFVVTPAPGEDTFEDVGIVGAPLADDDEAGTTRLNLRLPPALKQRVEEAANAEGLSLNAWFVRAAAASLGTPGRHPRGKPSGGDRFTGWVQ